MKAKKKISSQHAVVIPDDFEMTPDVEVETKGHEDLDVPLKMERLKQWCADINKVQSSVRYDYVFVDEESFNKYHPKTFGSLITSFREYKD